ncbi:MAG: peptidase M23, partial [Rhodospirillales bacterium]|nr:peptidase M23 [Rhodospirillales bacterium]
IDGILGQWLLSGEPVGIMQNDGNAGGNKKPLLYLELRRNGQPINPVPWLAVGKGKANG